MGFSDIIGRILDDPITYSVAFSFVVIALAIFIRIAGSPLSFLIRLIHILSPVAIKELRGEAGRAGIVNIFIVACITLLAVVVLIKPSILALFKSESTNSFVFSVVILIISAVAFLTSLKLVSDYNQFLKYFSSKKDHN